MFVGWVNIRAVSNRAAADRFAGLNFEVVHAGPREILQRAENEAGIFTRTLRLDATGYGFDLELAFDSRLPSSIETRFKLGWPARTSSDSTRCSRSGKYLRRKYSRMLRASLS